MADDEFDVLKYMMPLGPGDIKAMAERELSTPCRKCGAMPVKQWTHDLDIVCPNRKTYGDGHAYFPIDTGPFSFGRRVD